MIKNISSISSISKSPFIDQFRIGSQSSPKTGLDNLVKFVLQKNNNLIDFLLSFYSLVQSSFLQEESNLPDDVKKFKDLLKVLDKNSLVYISDVIEQLGLIKEGKPLLREFNSNFNYGIEVINHISDLCMSIGSVNKVINLYSGLGILKELICSNLEYKQIDCYDSDEKLNEFNKLINSNIKVQTTDILHGEDINGQYDLVITDIPENIKNIIYAKLCSKIKELKIRGTKSEPLIIQLVSQLLKPNGKAIVIVSNSFLFGDSKQHVETRKFIYENSSEIQVISLSNKKSILYWTKSSGSISVTFKNSSAVQVANDTQIKESGYSFFQSNYVFNSTNIETSDPWKLENLIEIKPFNQTQHKINQQVKLLYSYSNSNFASGVIPEKYDYVFVTKDENIFKQDYLNYYLLGYFKSNIDLITKGKTKILCLDKINNLVIEKKSIEFQNNIISFIATNEQINSLVEKQIANIEKIRSYTINSFILISDFVKLSSIATISNQTDGVDSIGIYKNSSQAGKVFKVTEPLKSDNIYFISLNDSSSTTPDFLYNYMVDKQDQLINLAKINNTISLSRKNIESFEIPNIPIQTQNKINESMEHFTYLTSLTESYLNGLANLNIFNTLTPSS